MALSPRHQRFVAEYLVDQHVTKSAERAGYSKKTAYSIGSELLKKPEIQAEIKKGMDALKAKAMKRAEKRGITKEWWLRELELIAKTNMDDFAVVEEVAFSNGKSGQEYGVKVVDAVLTKDRRKSLGRVIKKLGMTKAGITIELHSKQAALETIGKHFGWVKENVHHSGGTNDRVSHVDEAALKAALKKIEEDV